MFVPVYNRGVLHTDAFKYCLYTADSVESDLSTSSSWEETPVETPEDHIADTRSIFSWNRQIELLEPFLIHVEREASRFRAEAEAAPQGLLPGVCTPDGALAGGPRKNPGRRQRRAHCSISFSSSSSSRSKRRRTAAVRQQQLPPYAHAAAAPCFSGVSAPAL